MKVRDSGMPAEEMWSSFFDPASICRKLGLNSSIKDAVEFGSGYGTFSLEAASIINGSLYAIDIETEMIELLRTKIDENGIKNIKLLQRDFIAEGTGLKDNSVDYVMLFNILHGEDPEKLLSKAYRILRRNGKAAVIHWIHSSDTPRGPSLDVRPTPQTCIQWLLNAGFISNKEVIDLPPYHFGVVGIKN